MSCSWTERNQCCENYYTTQTNLQIQFIPTKQPMTLKKKKTRTNNFTIYMGGKKDPERPKKCGTGGINLSNFRLYYQDTMVQAQKHKHRAMEQDTKLWDKPTLL